MKVGTIRRSRDSSMWYGSPASRTRDPRERSLPTDHSPAALAGTPVQPANISVTRRRSARSSPSSSFTTLNESQRPPRGVAARRITIALT